MDTTQVLAVTLVGLVLGWYALGVTRNVRRGNAVLKWMQAGLPGLAERATLRWLGSSAVELNLVKPRPPFRRAEFVLVFEPRDVPWLWLLARARGRRDVLLIRAQLQRPPRLEYDLLAPESWSARERLKHATGRDWAEEPLDTLTLRAPAAALPLAREAAPPVLAAARRVLPTTWRLSARREYPQLELHLPLPDPRRADAQQFFASLRALAERLAAKD